MKKFITGILVALMMIIPFSSALAMDNNTTAQKLKADRAAVKQALVQKRADIKAQYVRNQALRDQIKAKHLTIKTSLAALRKNNDDTSKAKIAQVKTALVNLTTSREALNGLKDAGKPYWEQLKVNVKALNLDAAMSSLNSIAGVRDSRLEPLTKINSVLDSIITILAQK